VRELVPICERASEYDRAADMMALKAMAGLLRRYGRYVDALEKRVLKEIDDVNRRATQEAQQ
jgi:hypothetical protein